MKCKYYLIESVSTGIIHALDEARKRKSKIFGILGKDGGYTATVADIIVVIPPLNPNLITPIAEAYQGVVWHCLVSHLDLQVIKTKW